MSNRTLTITLITFFILLSAGFMGYYYKTTRSIPRTLRVIGNEGHKVDTFSFYNQDGRLITRKDVENKVYVVEYFFTTCKGICPKMNESMARVYQAYRGNPDFMILSHSVDPEKDTIGAMKAYSQRFNADSKQWMFLTGSKQRLYDVAFDSYLISAVDSSRPSKIEEAFIHDNHFVLVDRWGRLRGNFYDGLKAAEVDSLISDIQLLLAEKE
jgi:protein SCO1/2